MMMMMKYAFALALFHFWYSGCNTLNLNINKEIIRRLDDLSKGNRSISPNTVRIPSNQMNKNAASCVNVFVRELQAILQNLTVHRQDEHLVVEVKRNLDLLRPQQEQNDRICTMENNTNVRPLRAYRTFLKKLNTSKK